MLTSALQHCFWLFPKQHGKSKFVCLFRSHTLFICARIFDDEPAVMIDDDDDDAYAGELS